MAEQVTPVSANEGADQPAQPIYGVNAATVIWALILLLASLVWMQQAGLVSHGVQLAESVPVVPAVGGLLLLTLLLPLLSRLPGMLKLNRAGVLLVYAFLCISVSTSSVGVARMLFPNATALFYFATPENDFVKLQGYIPDWLAPKNPEIIREMYEAADDEAVPWRPWIVPLISYTILLGAFFTLMLCVMTLFRKQWSDRERLTFPIVHLVTEISGGEEGRSLAFFKEPAMWIGFALAALYNVMNILNAWNPAVPAMGRSYDLGGLFTERPWSAIRPLSIAWRPENFGLGYLVPTEITFSVWVFYLLQRFANVAAVSTGYEVSSFPFVQEQSFGAYLALGVFLIWVGREQLAAIFRKAFTGDPSVDDSNEPMSYRVAVWGAIISAAVMLMWANAAGMALWTAGIYFTLLILFALVYARARAEAGAAMVWLFPFYQHKKMMLSVLGSKPFVTGNNWGNLTIFSVLMFLSRGYFQSMMAYQIEATKIAEQARIRQRAMAWWLVVALVVGLAGAYVIHLQAYYKHGANILEGGTTQGGYRTRLAVQEFEELSSFMRAHKSPDRARTAAAGVGILVTVALVGLRSVFLRFPLHPLGYAMVTAYGYPLWGPFFIVWIIKTIVLRIGGMGMYRRLIPFFLGIVVGHFFTAGLVWGLVSNINEMYRRYVVHFG
ncbi:MAG: hypothetical protein J7M38_06470 [Armatimonadetes bacterium]|nr:hypothetical protein [Armatimonadota bacterium]